MKKSIIISSAIVIVIISGIFLLQTKKNSNSLKHVTLGIQTSPAMALVMVAKDKGFFAAQGLDLELKQFAAGKLALQAFLGGSLDFAISGDVPVTLSTLQGNHFVIPAQVVRKTQNEVRVVANKNGDLNNPEAYFKAKKRKLDTSIGGGPEFFTYQFLNKLGITNDQVQIISQSPADMPSALVSGSIDAIAIFDPFAFIAEKKLGDKAVTFTAPDIYSELYVLEAKEAVKEDSTILDALLKGLFEAQKYTEQNPQEAKEIVIQYTKLDKETIDGIWKSFDFHVALTPQLLDYLNQEVAWAKNTGKVSMDAPVPNFREIIFDSSLRRIDPYAVQL